MVKKILVYVIICSAVNSYAQTTSIPDPVFENALINLGLDIGPVDGSVPTANIDTVQTLSIGFLTTLSDLSGIEDFTALSVLWCQWGQLTSLDVSQNTNLIELICFSNQLTSLSIHPNLSVLICDDNSLTELDLSQNTMTALDCYNNDLSCLNLNNGAIAMLSQFDATGNPSLSCIEVDNVSWANTNLTSIDSGTSFSASCPGACAATAGIVQTEIVDKELLKIVDYLGRETTFKPNTPLIYIYSDGSRERIMQVEN